MNDNLSLEQYLKGFPYLKAMNLELIAVNVFTHKKKGLVSDHLMSLYEICKYLSKEMEQIIQPFSKPCSLDDISNCITSNDKSIITFDEHRIKSFTPENYVHEFTATENQIFNPILSK